MNAEEAAKAAYKTAEFNRLETQKSKIMEAITLVACAKDFESVVIAFSIPEDQRRFTRIKISEQDAQFILDWLNMYHAHVCKTQRDL